MACLASVAYLVQGGEGNSTNVELLPFLTPLSARQPGMPNCLASKQLPLHKW